MTTARAGWPGRPPAASLRIAAGNVAALLVVVVLAGWRPRPAAARPREPGPRRRPGGRPGARRPGRRRDGRPQRRRARDAPAGRHHRAGHRDRPARATAPSDRLLDAPRGRRRAPWSRPGTDSSLGSRTRRRPPRPSRAGDCADPVFATWLSTGRPGAEYPAPAAASRRARCARGGRTRDVVLGAPEALTNDQVLRGGQRSRGAAAARPARPAGLVRPHLDDLAADDGVSLGARCPTGSCPGCGSARSPCSR